MPGPVIDIDVDDNGGGRPRTRHRFGCGGLIGGLLATAITAILVAALAEPVSRVSALYGGRFVLSGLDFLETASLIGLAALLGIIGAWLGAARLIARIEPRD